MTRLFISLFLILPGILRLSYTDLKCKELEHIAILSLLPAAIFTDVSLLSRSIGAVIPFLFFYFYGFGDILMLSALGTVFGYLRLIEIFILSSLSMGSVCIFLLLRGKIKKEDTLPFAPYISLSCIMLILKDMMSLY